MWAYFLKGGTDDLKSFLPLLQRLARLYTEKRLTRASAALSFFLTSTLFPLLIILYTLLGSSSERIERILGFARSLMAAETADTIAEFLRYVALNNSQSMMMAALVLLLTSASAAVRTLQATIGELQGEPRYRGLRDFLFSLIFSLLFTAALYFSILVMLTGRDFLVWFNGIFPIFDISAAWQVLRYPLMAAIEYGILCGLYLVSLPHKSRYPIRPGALLATAALVGVSVAFSAFIGASARYPLVYGSLASVILLMMWLYTCCLMIFCGAALNVALRDQRREDQQRRFAPKEE